MPAAWVELTAFQRDLIFVISGQKEASGQSIKEEIEADYSTEITHGRLYPNLDTLADKGLVEKGAINRRSNYYALTSKGRDMIRKRREWEDERLEAVNGIELTP